MRIFVFIFPRRKIFDSMKFSRLAFKVFPRIQGTCGDPLTASPQLVLTSMYWLWVYDYFLTLGDEV